MGGFIISERKVIAMTQILSIAENIHGGVLSLILLFAVMMDTGLALKIRIPKGQFLSKRLLIGAGYNLALSIIPVICDILISNKWFNSVDILTLRVVMIIAFLAVGLGVLGSCIANYSVAYPQAKRARKLAEKFLPKELEEKLKHIEADEGDVDNGNK